MIEPVNNPIKDIKKSIGQDVPQVVKIVKQNKEQLAKDIEEVDKQGEDACNQNIDVLSSVYHAKILYPNASVNKIATLTGISHYKVRIALDKLKKVNEIGVIPTDYLIQLADDYKGLSEKIMEYSKKKIKYDLDKLDRVLAGEELRRGERLESLSTMLKGFKESTESMELLRQSARSDRMEIEKISKKETVFTEKSQEDLEKEFEELVEKQKILESKMTPGKKVQ